MKALALFTLILLLLGCAPTTSNNSLSQNITNLDKPSNLTCHYTKSFLYQDQEKKSDWYFSRTSQQVQTRDDLTGQGERWERDPKGKLFYTRLFFQDKVTLNFTSGDLATIGSLPNWNELSSIIDPNQLSKSLQEKEYTANPMIRHYVGNLKGMQTEVDWLDKLQLPSRIEKQTPEGRLLLSLVDCTTQNTLATDFDSKIVNFRNLDFTDLGDMEDDPTVKKIERLLGGHQHPH